MLWIAPLLAPVLADLGDVADIDATVVGVVGGLRRDVGLRVVAR